MGTSAKNGLRNKILKPEIFHRFLKNSVENTSEYTSILTKALF